MSTETTADPSSFWFLFQFHSWYISYMPSDYEIYPNAPVVLVAVETRHASTAPLTPEQEAVLKGEIAGQFPISSPIQTLSLNFGQDTRQARIQQPPRYTNRDRNIAVTFGQQSIIVETTHHQHFEKLNEIITLVANARQTAAPIDGLERVGIRYINEIRAPAPSEIVDWNNWVNSELLGPNEVVKELNFVQQNFQALSTIEVGEGKWLNLNYGPRYGHAVQSGPLVRDLPPPSPFFLLDVDAYWIPASGIPEFDTDLIASISGELHDASHILFESLVTEQLRNEVFRNV